MIYDGCYAKMLSRNAIDIMVQLDEMINLLAKICVHRQR